MGCVQAKQSTNSPPRGLDKLKLENGYVVGRGGVGRPVSQKQLGRDSGRLFRHQVNHSNETNGGKVIKVEAAINGDGGGEGKLISREGEKEGGGGGGNVSQRRKAGSDELVDGWPKWLTDNIPKETLVGLVPKSAEAYDKLDKIGQGTYSNVYKARERETGKIVALKKVRFDTSESESVKFMAREIRVLQGLDHPNVIKLEGLATSRMQYSLYLVFDFMQSDLARIISRPDGRLTEPQVKFYMHQLLSGLQHCHERGILHRDIKGSNLLIDKNGMLKIADFGLANFFSPNQKRPLTSRVVTLWYRAPELLLGSTDYGVGIDLWSAGCLLAEMFAGRPIMPGRTEVEQLHRIFKLCGSPSEDYWRKLKLSTSFRPPQPYKPSLLETFRDFPSSSLGLLATLLALDPTYRGSASSALQSEFFSTSPLACDPSDLPVIYKEEDQPTQTSERRKSRASKMKRRSRTYREGQRKNDLGTEKSRGDTESSKEGGQEKIAEHNFQGPETGSSTGSTSSGVKPRRYRDSPPPSMSPVVSSHQKRSPRTEGHPNAIKNIKNLPPLRVTKTSTNNFNEDNDNMYRATRRSVSTMDFRKLDQVKISKLYALDD